MEEGPEPPEWVERIAEHHQHESSHGSAGGSHLLPAVTAALLAVLAAFGALLSGHAANQAILKQTKASDQWAYYQAKSTKGHIYDVNREMLAALAAQAGGPSQAQVSRVIDRFGSQVAKYDNEKEQVQEEAKTLERESEHEFHKHHQFALGVVCFQIGIVLASVSILVRFRAFYFLSIIAGCVGIVFLVIGVLSP